MLARIKHPHLIFLSAILIFNVYLRLWGINHLFYWLNDYDEGAYSLGGRLISQGYLPYRDFTLVHPPFYDLVLATIYKIFGYNFFYGRYFSVLLSFACIILVYLIVRKLYHPTAGLVASLLFTVFPGFYLLWYRVVQEPLGIFLVLLSLYFATSYIKSRENGNHLLFSGFCLGLAVATKYIFIPAVLAFIIGIWAISTDWNLRSFRSYFSGLRKRDTWLLISGTIVGFLIVVGFFIIQTRQEFFSQTFSSQMGYRVGNTISYIVTQLRELPSGIWKILVFSRGTFHTTIAMVCVLLGIVFLIALFFKKRRSKPDIFLLIAALICLPLCSLFNPFGTMNYFVSFYIFILLAIITFIPAININTVNEQITIRSMVANLASIILVLAVLIYIGGTIALRIDYSFLNSKHLTYEEQSYRDTINYLESVGAKKVYTIDPIIIALAPNLNPTPVNFDMFGAVMTMKKSPAVFYQEVLNQGIDYAVIDQSALLSINPQGKSIGELSLLIRENGVLVKSFAPNEVGILGTSIYKVTRP